MQVAPSTGSARPKMVCQPSTDPGACRHARNRDHSKWAATLTAVVGPLQVGAVCAAAGAWPVCTPRVRQLRYVQEKVVCVADQNRAQTQELRGGSAICFNVPALWQAFSSIVNQTEPCSA